MALRTVMPCDGMDYGLTCNSVVPYTGITRQSAAIEKNSPGSMGGAFLFLISGKSKFWEAFI
jgi:hypothetical protein